MGARRDVHLGARGEIQPTVHECQRVGQLQRIGAGQHDGPRTEGHAGLDQCERLIDRHVQAAADRANEVNACGFELGQVGHHGGQLAVGDGQGDLVVKRTGLAVSEHAGRQTGHIVRRAQAQAHFAAGAHQPHGLHMQGGQLTERQAAHVAGEVENGLDLGDMGGIQRWQLRDEVARQPVNHQLFASLGLQHQCVGFYLTLDFSLQLVAEVLS